MTLNRRSSALVALSFLRSNLVSKLTSAPVVLFSEKAWFSDQHQEHVYALECINLRDRYAVML